MLRRANPSIARRLGGAALIGALNLTSGHAALAAAPAAAPEPNPLPQSQPGTLSTNPLRVDANGYPRYDIGFARVYDGDAPVTVNGAVVRTDFGEPKSAVWVYGIGTTPDGAATSPQLWQIEGGSASGLNADTRSSAAAATGQDVTARGYYAFDRSCDAGCLVNGRAVTNPDGSPFLKMTGALDCTQDQRVNHTCPTAMKPSPDPKAPTEAEIRAALAKGGKSTDIVIHAFTSNSVKRAP
jgi:hypothetical protein